MCEELINWLKFPTYYIPEIKKQSMIETTMKNAKDMIKYITGTTQLTIHDEEVIAKFIKIH